VLIHYAQAVAIKQLDGNGGQGNTKNCSRAAWKWIGNLTNSRLVEKQQSMMGMEGKGTQNCSKAAC